MQNLANASGRSGKKEQKSTDRKSQQKKSEKGKRRKPQQPKKITFPKVLNRQKAYRSKQGKSMVMGSKAKAKNS